jgi:hypothetical protein
MISESIVSSPAPAQLRLRCQQCIIAVIRHVVRPDFLFCAAIFVLLYFRLFAFPAIPYADLTADDRLFLNDATRMLHWQTLYRDFFNLNFPGTFVWYFWILKLVGVRAWIAPATVLLLGMALTRITLAYSRRILSGSLAYLPSLLFIAFGYSHVLDATHHWFSVLLISGASLVLLGRQSPRRLAMVGALCAAATWFTQSRGILATIAFSLFLCWDYRQPASATGGPSVGPYPPIACRPGRSRRELFSRLSWLLGTFCAVLALLLCYHVAAASPPVFFADTILFPLTNYRKFEGVNSFDIFGADLMLPALSLGSIAAFLQRMLLYPLAPGMYILAFVRLRRMRGTKVEEVYNDGRRALMLALVLGPLLFLGVASSADSSRLAYDSYFGFLLLTWYCRQEAAGKLLLIALTLLSVASMFSVFRPHSKVVLDIPSGRVAYRNDSDCARWLKDNTKSGDYVFEAAWGNYYYQFGLRNPAPIPYLTNSGFTRPEDVRAAIEGLERHHVRYILMEETLNSSIGGLNPDYLQAFRFFVAKNYRLKRCFNVNSGTELWERSTS